MDEPLWIPTPKQVEVAKITELRHLVNQSWGLDLADSTALWQFSVDKRQKFWRTVIEFCDLKAESWGERDVINADSEFSQWRDRDRMWMSR